MPRHQLGRYRKAGGGVPIERFEGSGHFPPIDAADAMACVPRVASSR